MQTLIDSPSTQESVGHAFERDMGVSAGTATEHASAVMSVLGEAASGGELEAIRAQLPQEFNALFR